MDQRLRWTERLHIKADFRRVFQTGRRFSLQGVTLWAVRRTLTEFPSPRLAVSVGRAYGNAVARNRIKRILREIFRLNKTRIEKNVDLVLSARAFPPPVRRSTVEPVVFELWRRAGLWTETKLG